MTTEEEKREQAIQNIAEWLRRNPFSVAFKVKKKPAGIKIIFEVTQEEMYAMLEKEDWNGKGGVEGDEGQTAVKCSGLCR